MADALAYAVDKLDPDVLVDVATLTGAMKVALGQQVGGFFANNDVARRRDPRRRGGRRGAAVALPAGRRLRGEAVLDGRRRRQRPRRSRRDHRGAVPPALRREAALGPPRHRLRRRRPRRQLRVDRRPHGLRRPRAAELAGRPRTPGGHEMKGLTVRWSLADAPAGVEAELATYVADTSHAKFTGMAGLQFKTWRMRAGEWFEGLYVFVVGRGAHRVPADLHRRRRRLGRLAADRQLAGPDRGVRHRRRRRGLGRLHSRVPGTISNHFASKRELFAICTSLIGRWLAQATSDHIDDRGAVGLFPEDAGDRTYRLLSSAWVQLRAYALADPMMDERVQGVAPMIQRSAARCLRG